MVHLNRRGEGRRQYFRSKARWVCFFIPECTPEPWETRVRIRDYDGFDHIVDRGVWKCDSGYGGGGVRSHECDVENRREESEDYYNSLSVIMGAPLRVSEVPAFSPHQF